MKLNPTGILSGFLFLAEDLFVKNYTNLSKVLINFIRILFLWL
jgi:hypothetical protein